MPYSMEDMVHSVTKLTDSINTKLEEEEKGSNMNDIAGLLALMQGNKGMDLPGLLALCKEKGYDRSFGGEGMFMFVFLILFLFAGGGWNNLGRNGQEAMQNFCAAQGINCQEIIGLHDRIADARSVSQMGFQQLQTWLCEAIANVTNSVRNQGDRAVDATRNVGDAVRDCCCELRSMLSAITAEVKGVSRDIADVNTNLSNKIDLAYERGARDQDAMECRLSGQIKDLRAEVALGFERQTNTLTNMAKDNEIARQAREIEALKGAAQGSAIAEAATSKIINAILTRAPATAGANAAILGGTVVTPA